MTMQGYLVVHFSDGRVSQSLEVGEPTRKRFFEAIDTLIGLWSTLDAFDSFELFVDDVEG
jgi:hypothetical protein